MSVPTSKRKPQGEILLMIPLLWEKLVIFFPLLMEIINVSVLLDLLSVLLF